MMRFTPSSSRRFSCLFGLLYATRHGSTSFVVGPHAARMLSTTAAASIGTPTNRMMTMMNVSTTRTVSTKTTGTTDTRLFDEELNVIYDSKCNVCKLEIDFLARRDEKVNGGRRKLKMTDLESGSYNANDAANGFVSYADGMAAIHAITPDGKVMTGVPVFSAAYEQVGLGWVFAASEWPLLKPVLDLGYNLFAKYRTFITRGSSLDNLVEAYEEKQLLNQKVGEQEACEVCPPKTGASIIPTIPSKAV